jgi:hypothetical protein
VEDGPTHPAGRIALERFTAEDARYATYRRIKYAVFMAEQHWSATAAELGAHMADADPFDERGRFWLARTDAGEPAGVIRALATAEAFPHRDLFEHHLGIAAVRPLLAALGTVNALAVLPSYRGLKVTVTREGWSGGVGSLLVLASLRGLEDEGVQAVVATAQGSVSTRLFLRLGFHAIDPPCMTPLQPRLPLTNVGLVLGSPAHRAAEVKRGLAPRVSRLHGDAAALLAYFEGRDRRVTGAGSMEEALRFAQDERGARKAE